jgi:hypothetical protein
VELLLVLEVVFVVELVLFVLDVVLAVEVELLILLLLVDDILVLLFEGCLLVVELRGFTEADTTAGGAATSNFIGAEVLTIISTASTVIFTSGRLMGIAGKAIVKATFSCAWDLRGFCFAAREEAINALTKNRESFMMAARSRLSRTSVRSLVCLKGKTKERKPLL